MKEAWIGDAVLALYARLKILREDGVTDGGKAERLTSNQFLAGFGEPSEVEAQIGQVYLADGLQPAFAWIEATLTPVFERREANRRK
jgi:dsRNA-specific ribonuclease